MSDAAMKQQALEASPRAKRQLHRLGVETIPEGWTLSTVGEACSIRNDLRLPLSVEVRASMQGNYPYYGPTGVLDMLNEYRVDGEFALIGEDGDHFLDVQTKSQTIRVSGKFNVNNHAHVIGSTAACAVDWFFYFFQHRDIAHSLTRQGAGRYKLTKAALATLPILLPPPEQQQSVAETLRSWDTAIECLEQLIDARQRQNQALIHQLVFGQRRLESFAGEGQRTKHRWFDLPDDWSVAPIGSLAKEISERNGNGTGHEVLSCSKYEGFVRSLEYFKKQIYSSDLSGYKKIWQGDFGFPSNHIEEGSIGLQNLVDVGLVSPIYTVFRFDTSKIDNTYAYGVLKTSLYQHIFEVSTSASVDRRGSLRWNQFAKIPFPVPSLEEQKAISGVLGQNKGLIDGLTQELCALKRQKRGLMQKLLTGEWRLPDSGDELGPAGASHG